MLGMVLSSAPAVLLLLPAFLGLSQSSVNNVTTHLHIKTYLVVVHKYILACLFNIDKEYTASQARPAAP